MWNIMKSQNYQIKRDNLVIYAALLCLILPLFGLILDDAGFDRMDGSQFMVSMFGFLPFLLLIWSLVIVTRICGWDMNDKTINYELLSGHSRAQVYFGRVITGLIWAVCGAVLVSLLPVLLLTAVKGWGHSLDFGEAAVRYAVMLCPYFRWACEMILLTFLVRNSHAAIILGFVLFEAGIIFSAIVQELADIKIDVQLACQNLMELSDVSNSRNVLIGKELVTVYEGAVAQELVTGSVFVSLAVGVACLLLGYAVFRKRDMN